MEHRPGATARFIMLFEKEEVNPKCTLTSILKFWDPDR